MKSNLNQENKFTSIDEILLKHLEELEKSDEHYKDNDWIYASELGKCKRKSFLRRLGIAKSDSIPDRILFTFEIGKRMHEWIQEILGKAGVLIEKEGTIIDEELHYRGRSDAVLNLYDQEAKRYKLVVADIKTQRGEAFFHRAKQKSVKDFQKMQIGSYFYFLKKLRYPKLEEARLFFFDRSGGCRDEVIIKFTTEDLQKVLDEISTLNKFWETQILPARCGIPSSWECKMCGYKKMCKEVDTKNLTIKDLKKNYVKNIM